jgi:hypothetical protein
MLEIWFPQISFRHVLFRKKGYSQAAPSVNASVSRYKSKTVTSPKEPGMALLTGCG